MGEPIPSFEEMVTAVVAAAWNDVFLSDSTAKRILNAVLPLVLKPATEALRPFALSSTFFAERYLDTDAIYDASRRGEYVRIEVGHLRSARTTLAGIKALVDPSPDRTDEP